MTSILSPLALLIFPVLMAFAAFSDLLTMRISNRLVFAVLIGFAIVALVAQLPLDTIGMHLACAAATLAVTFSFFAFGWIGGGDAKLIAATALWFGFSMMLQYIVFASLLGGALTLIILALRRWPLPERLRGVVWLDRLHDDKNGVPYGVALAAAALLIYPDSLVFHQLIG